MINVQDGISPYRTDNHSKINKAYMYLYLILKSISVAIDSRHPFMKSQFKGRGCLKNSDFVKKGQ